MTPEQKEAFRCEVLEEVERIEEQAEHVALGIACKRDVADAHGILLGQICKLRRALAASQPAPAADTGQAVAWRARIKAEHNDGNPSDWVVSPVEIAHGGIMEVQPLYSHPAPLDAERVREAWAYRVHDCHIARSPVKARAKFPEATEHLYPASRHADAIEMARLLGGTCTPLYPPEDAR